jgi:hypothetical protein
VRGAPAALSRLGAYSPGHARAHQGRSQRQGPREAWRRGQALNFETALPRPCNRKSNLKINLPFRIDLRATVASGNMASMAPRRASARKPTSIQVIIPGRPLARLFQSPGPTRSSDLANKPLTQARGASAARPHRGPTGWRHKELTGGAALGMVHGPPALTLGS